MKKNLLLIFIFVQGIVFAKCLDKIFPMIVENTMECLAEAPKQFSVEICQEMMREGNDNTLAKYDECKCLGACTAKRMRLMTDKGEINAEKFKEYIGLVGSQDWTQEANAIIEKCKNIKNTGNDCDYVFQWTTCGLNNSEMVMQLFKTFTGKKDDKGTK